MCRWIFLFMLTISTPITFWSRLKRNWCHNGRGFSKETLDRDVNAAINIITAELAGLAFGESERLCNNNLL